MIIYIIFFFFKALASYNYYDFLIYFAVASRFCNNYIEAANQN